MIRPAAIFPHFLLFCIFCQSPNIQLSPEEEDGRVDDLCEHNSDSKGKQGPQHKPTFSLYPVRVAVPQSGHLGTGNASVFLLHTVPSALDLKKNPKNQLWHNPETAAKRRRIEDAKMSWHGIPGLAPWWAAATTPRSQTPFPPSISPPYTPTPDSTSGKHNCNWYSGYHQA